MINSNKKMKDLIELLFKKSIELGDYEYTQEQINKQWIGNSPASKFKIEEIENKNTTFWFSANSKAYYFLPPYTAYTNLITPFPYETNI